MTTRFSSSTMSIGSTAAASPLAVGDPLEAPDGVNHLREILGEQLVGLHPDLDVIEQVPGPLGADGDQADERRRARQRRPETGHLHQHGLARTTRHSHGEQAAA